MLISKGVGINIRPKISMVLLPTIVAIMAESGVKIERKARNTLIGLLSTCFGIAFLLILCKLTLMCRRRIRKQKLQVEEDATAMAGGSQENDGARVAGKTIEAVSSVNHNQSSGGAEEPPPYSRT
ncbi:hypothetical protein WG66_013641 [Moniliophthora roreri]|nr:hypothetical protein WG66_013641 [Moniliophthora roreri]